jgi:hypothetical protein
LSKLELLDTKLIDILQIVIDFTEFLGNEWIPNEQRSQIMLRLDYWEIVQGRINRLSQPRQSPFALAAIAAWMGVQDTIDVRAWTADLAKLLACDKHFLNICNARLKAKGADAIAGKEIDSLKVELETLINYVKQNGGMREKDLRTKFANLTVWKRIDATGVISADESAHFFRMLHTAKGDDLFAFMGYLFPQGDRPRSADAIIKRWKLRPMVKNRRKDLNSQNPT